MITERDESPLLSLSLLEQHQKEQIVKTALQYVLNEIKDVNEQELKLKEIVDYIQSNSISLSFGTTIRLLRIPKLKEILYSRGLTDENVKKYFELNAIKNPKEPTTYMGYPATRVFDEHTWKSFILYFKDGEICEVEEIEQKDNK